MAIDETGLTKGLMRKLNALRKSVGDDLAEEVFAKWLERQAASQAKENSDPVAMMAMSGWRSSREWRTPALRSVGCGRQEGPASTRSALEPGYLMRPFCIAGFAIYWADLIGGVSRLCFLLVQSGQGRVAGFGKGLVS